MHKQHFWVLLSVLLYCYSSTLPGCAMSPNGHAFASLKSAKKGSALSAIGKGVLQIGPFFLPAFIFSNDELEDTLLGLDPLTETGCTAVFNKESFQLFHGSNTELTSSESSASISTDYAWITNGVTTCETRQPN